MLEIENFDSFSIYGWDINKKYVWWVIYVIKNIKKIKNKNKKKGIKEFSF